MPLLTDTCAFSTSISGTSTVPLSPASGEINRTPPVGSGVRGLGGINSATPVGSGALLPMSSILFSADQNLPMHPAEARGGRVRVGSERPAMVAVPVKCKC